MDIHTIPCKRPKVTIEPIDGSGLYLHRCHVPGCGWTYRSVKSDHLGAPHHRQQHKAAVPAVELRKHATGYTVHCADHGQILVGGNPRHTATRTDAEAMSAYHLSHDHGLVSC